MYRISSVRHPPWYGIASSNSMTWSERGKQFSAATLLHSPPQMLSASPSCVGDGFVHVSGVFYPWKKPTEKRGCQKKGNVALWALWKNVAGWRRRENIWDVRSKTVGILATFPVKYNDLRQRHSRYFRNPFKLTLRVLSSKPMMTLAAFSRRHTASSPKSRGISIVLGQTCSWNV